MSRTTWSRYAVAAAVALAALPAGSQPVAAAPRHTQVHGGYLNSAAFVPTSVTRTSDPHVHRMTFTGGSQWNGDFTGQTVVHGVATMDVRTGVIVGTFTDTLHGTYTPDRRTGTLTVSGTFRVDENDAFTARGRIVRATCGFAGSRGWMEFFGFGLNGGYRGTWVRPAAPPPTAACAV